MGFWSCFTKTTFDPKNFGVVLSKFTHSDSKKVPIKVGIIGGSGLDNPDIMENRQEKIVSTIFGPPSDKIIEGTVGKQKCALLARHGRKHSTMPGNVNYRANICALKKVGCTHVLASFACGSLCENYKRGDLVIPSDFLDRTTKRQQTFFDGSKKAAKGICHLPMYPIFSEPMRQILLKTACELGISVHDGATVVVIEGPRYSSRAESNWVKQAGGHLVNMTMVPEVILAKEAGLLYGAVAIATDYDSWRDDTDHVSAQSVLEVFAKNIQKVTGLLLKTIENIPKQDWANDIQEAQNLVASNLLTPE
ncbi:S-methyl-5'-thioadenosine phosphorylase-like [Teleopsis dalmanni]|uniref:S-methyl-5'-thioadenosine phosphorylase-like n=1 Tax=Teleopsis dalmanni TaxID=139649 RepID=UPI0018CF4F0D|nr:S-methyl-5'-thioadenosine phosphorylase-like [Teleopsis dalmanni]